MGALMKTPRNAGPSTDSMSRSASKLSTWLPNAFRLTSMSIRWRGSGRLSVRLSASTIMPAQVPHTGRPSLTLSASADLKP